MHLNCEIGLCQNIFRKEDTVIIRMRYLRIFVLEENRKQIDAGVRPVMPMKQESWGY